MEIIISTILHICILIVKFILKKRRLAMKSTGIVRRVDQLGRIVIPRELRRVLEIGEKDSLEIFTDNEKIILQKYKPSQACVITGEITDKNKTLGNGKLVLSPKGIEVLLGELEKYSVQV